MAGRSSKSEATDIKDEWKECRTTIDRFDKILVDLRKTGMSVVTAVIGGAAFLLAHPRSITPAVQQNPTMQQTQNVLPPMQQTLADLPEVKVAVSLVIAALIVGLFTIDRVHASWLSAAVRRAVYLEENALGYKTTQDLSSAVRARQARALGFIIYFIFLAASWIVFMYGLETSQNSQFFYKFSFNSYQYWVSGGAFIALVIMIAFNFLVVRQS
jgi:hypothetical protein